MTHMLDTWGMPVQASNGRALQELDAAVLSLVSMMGDPAAEAAAAAATDDDLLLAAVAHAQLTLYRTSGSAAAQADAILDAIEPRIGQAPMRERLHFEAARARADGHRDLAARRLDEVLWRYPRDLLALRVAQDLYLFLGDARDLRDVVARVVGAWTPDLPGWAWVQGMYAFGLEEAGDYRRAEIAARAALAEHPNDVWACHALAHIFEMEGRPEEGLALLEDPAVSWQDSYFANHNWVHKALYHLEIGNVDVLLPLYDDEIRANRPLRWVVVVDCASVLWRLMLFGFDVRGRADALVDGVQALLDRPVHVLNDLHALMILALAERADLVESLLSANHAAPRGTTNRDALDRAGLGILDGFAAFGRGQYETAVEELVRAHPQASVIGGSHARRDVVDLTLLAAAVRSGDEDLVHALYSERIERKPSARLATDALIDANLCK